MPLTETIYTIPQDSIELSLQEEVRQVNNYFRIDQVGLGFGVLSDLSLWFYFQYLHRGTLESSEDEIGDTFLKFWYYLADFNDDTIHLGLLIKFRFPTGRNAYYSQDWRNLAFGNNEIEIGAVSQFDIYNALYIHLNLIYIFREGNNEDFYGGFYLNPLDEETYINLFGINPFSEDSFLSWNRLKDDYMSLAMAVNTDLLSPLIPYIEIYWSFRLYRKKIDMEDLTIEGAGVEPILISIGLRYFFSEDIYLGIYSIINPVNEEDYIKAIYGIDFSIMF